MAIANMLLRLAIELLARRGPPMIASLFVAGVAAAAAALSRHSSGSLDESWASVAYVGIIAWLIAFGPCCLGTAAVKAASRRRRGFRAAADQLDNLFIAARKVALHQGPVEDCRAVVELMQDLGRRTLGPLGIYIPVVVVPAVVVDGEDVAKAAMENAETLECVACLARQGALREARRVFAPPARIG